MVEFLHSGGHWHEDWKVTSGFMVTFNIVFC